MRYEDLIGNLGSMSNEELDKVILTGRDAREEEAAEKRGKAKAKKAPAPTKVASVSIDLDDMPD